MKKIFFTFSLIVLAKFLFSQGIVNSGAYLVVSSGASVYVDGGTSGNYTSTGASYIKTTSGLSNLILEGNFTNNSTTDAIDGVAYTKIQLNGGVQTIGGTKTSILGQVESAGTGAKTISTKQQISILTLNGQNVTLSDTVRILGKLNLTSGTLTTAGKLILRSTADSTAMLTSIASGIVTGDAIVERYIPGGTSKRRWRYLSSPINVSGSISLLQFQDDIFVTAPAGSGGGFDVNPFSSNASIRTYTESTAGAASLGWTNPTNISNTITTATGIEVFVRGSRNLANPYLNWTTPDNVTIDYIGALNTGTVVKSISFTNSGTSNADGFNLIGNPYASPINWASNTGWTRTSLNPWMYIYSAKTGTYNYINSDGVTMIGSDNDISPIVPSGQAFFVKATGSGASITFTESVKSTTTPFNFFRGISSKPVLKYSLIYNNEKSDQALLGFVDSCSSNGNDISEAVKFYNDKINVYSISSDNIAMAVDYRPAPTLIDSIRIAVWDYDTTNIQIGQHTLKFDSLSTIPQMSIYLIDKFLNTTTNLRTQNSYAFDITTDATSYGNNRFLLVFDATTGVSTTSISNNITIYPNPANDVINIGVADAQYLTEKSIITIKNLMGQELIRQENENLKNIQSIDISSLSEGIYVISVNIGGNVAQRKFIKK